MKNTWKWTILPLMGSAETFHHVIWTKWIRNRMSMRIVKNYWNRRSHFTCKHNKSRTLKMYSRHQKSENHFKIKISTNFAQNPSRIKIWKKMALMIGITKRAWWPKYFHKFWITPVARITPNKRKITMLKSQKVAESILNHQNTTHWKICHHLVPLKYKMIYNSNSINKTSVAQEIISKLRCSTIRCRRKTIRKT